LANTYGFRAEGGIKERRLKGAGPSPYGNDSVDRLPLDALGFRSSSQSVEALSGAPGAAFLYGV